MEADDPWLLLVLESLVDLETFALYRQIGNDLIGAWHSYNLLESSRRGDFFRLLFLNLCLDGRLRPHRPRSALHSDREWPQEENVMGEAMA